MVDQMADQIEYQDFARVAMRVGRILTVEQFPRARTPSYKVLVDFGPEIGQRWSSMQAALDYQAADLVDTLVIGVVNLPEKNIAGFRSAALILGVSDPSGRLSLLRPDRGAEVGSSVY